MHWKHHRQSGRVIGNGLQDPEERIHIIHVGRTMEGHDTIAPRHELEVGFERFARDRDLHLRDLLRELKKQGRLNEFDAIRKRTKLPAAVSAMDRTRNQL